MKGIELPINILVIVAVAIIVLLGVIALFYSSWFQGTGGLTAETAKQQACNALIRINDCAADTGSYGVGNYSGYNSLDEFCNGEYGLTLGDDAECMRLACGMNQCV